MNLHRIIAVACLTVGLTTTSIAQTTKEHSEIADDAQAALFNHDYKTALELAGKIADSSPNEKYTLVAADTMLRCGESKRAVKLFDEHIENRPADKPYLWQRGIALYFLGRYQAGAEQFEIHRKVNPNDVENAAWHFLCLAKKDSPESAKKLLLPAPNDSRAPMKEVLAMLASGDTDSVKKRMNSFADDKNREKSAKFYGNFYLGLYADALGDKKTAMNHMNAAAKDAPKNYMGDLARVYARHLER